MFLARHAPSMERPTLRCPQRGNSNGARLSTAYAPLSESVAWRPRTAVTVAPQQPARFAEPGCSEPARALASLDPRHADGGARRALEPVAARPPHGVRLNWRRRRVTMRCGGGRWAAPQAPAPRQGGAALAAIARCARPVAGARSRTTRAAAAPLRRGHPSHSSSSHAGRARAALRLELVPYPPHPARA